jgi:hypothetical protein
MTLRHVVYLAAIAAALVTLDIRVAAAQTHDCMVYLKDCHYGQDGLRYWGWRKARARPVSLTTDGSRSSSGDHNWGCGATDGAAAKGRSWGYSNRTAATYRALAECSRKTTRGCHIMSCSASVHSQAEVPVAWFNP